MTNLNTETNPAAATATDDSAEPCYHDDIEVVSADTGDIASDVTVQVKCLDCGLTGEVLLDVSADDVSWDEPAAPTNVYKSCGGATVESVVDTDEPLPTCNVCRRSLDKCLANQDDATPGNAKALVVAAMLRKFLARGCVAHPSMPGDAETCIGSMTAMQRLVAGRNDVDAHLAGYVSRLFGRTLSVLRGEAVAGVVSYPMDLELEDEVLADEVPATLHAALLLAFECWGGSAAEGVFEAADDLFDSPDTDALAGAVAALYRTSERRLVLRQADTVLFDSGEPSSSPAKTATATH